MKNNFEFPDELSKIVGLISLHFQRLVFVIFELVNYLQENTEESKKETSKYLFGRLVKLMNKLIEEEFNKNQYDNILKTKYNEAFKNVRDVQDKRNNTIHSNFIITYRKRDFTVLYNIRDVVENGNESIKKITIKDLEDLCDVTKKTIKDLSDFYYEFMLKRNNIT